LAVFIFEPQQVQMAKKMNQATNAKATVRTRSSTLELWRAPLQHGKRRNRRQKKRLRSKRPQDFWGSSALMVMHANPSLTTSDMLRTSRAGFAAGALFMPVPSRSTS
jgi:hypothetical protein